MAEPQMSVVKALSNEISALAQKYENEFTLRNTGAALAGLFAFWVSVLLNDSSRCSY